MVVNTFEHKTEVITIANVSVLEQRNEPILGRNLC